MFSDPVLVEEVRAGDRDAGLVLWRRHSPGCRVAVASVLDDPRATDRVLRGAFGRVLREIADGTDPVAPFHLHLRTTALLDACLDGGRGSSVGVTVGASEDGSAEGSAGATAPPVPVVRAFADLDRLDQAVLWASGVERATLREIAWTASVPVGQAAARLRDAETRLRAGWVEEMLDEPLPTPTCAWVVERVAVLRTGYLGPVMAERYERHLRDCGPCRTYVDDDARLVRTLVEALLRLPRPIDEDAPDGPRPAPRPCPEQAEPTLG